MAPISKHRFLLKHSTVGRMRFQELNHRLETGFARALENMLACADDVLRVEARENTGSVIIFYRAGYGNRSEIADHMLAAILKLEQGDSVLTAPVHPATSESSSLTSLITPIAYETLKLIATTLALAYTFARFYFFRNPLSSPVLTAMAIAGLLPAFIRTLQAIMRGNCFTTNSFTVSACLVAIMTNSQHTALEIIWVSELGEFLDQYSKQNFVQEVRDLFRAPSGKVFRLVDGVEVEIDAEQLEPGMIVCLSKGDNVPVDGRIVRFMATIDESGVTDSAVPVIKKVGDKVSCGSSLIDGKIQIRVEMSGKEKHLTAAVAFVEKSLANRSTVEIEADRHANIMLFLGLLVSATAYLLTGNLRTALAAQLITAFTCATSRAPSITIAGALAKSARRGALIQGGDCLERYASCDSFCFEKTGVLTESHGDVVDVITRTPWIKSDTILRLAIIAQASCRTPQAVGIRKCAESLNLHFEHSDHSEEMPSGGIRAVLAGDSIVVGNSAVMDEIGADRSYFRKKDSLFRARGFTTVYIAKNNKIQGMIVLRFPTRPGCRESIIQLQALGIKEFHIICEDDEQFVSEMAHHLEIDNWMSDGLPDHRADYIQRLQDAGKKVAVVGDGMNDVLALSNAYVGIAMGKGGAPLVLSAPYIMLAQSDLLILPELKRIANRTFQITTQNYYLTMATNICAVVLTVTGNLNPLPAGTLHLSHALGIFANSSRILN